MIVDPMADLDGFLCTAEQYAALGIDLIDIMPPPEDTTARMTFASRLGELVIPRVVQIKCGPKPRGSADRLHAERPHVKRRCSSEAPGPPACDPPEVLQQGSVQTRDQAFDRTVLITEAEVALGTAAATGVRPKD